MLQKGVGAQNGVVGLHHGSGHLWRGRHREGELGLASVVHGKPLEEEGSEAGSGSSAGGMEDEKSLKASAVVSELADPVQNEVNDFLRETNNDGENGKK